MKSGSQKGRGSLKNPQIQKCWEQFNDFYISFIQDIDHFYKINPNNNNTTIDKSRSKININESKNMIGVTADGADDDEDITPEIKHLRQQLTKYKYQFTNIPEISQNILGIIRALKEEDK